MYAYSWAEGVLRTYKTSCTRAGQIDACIVQKALTVTEKHPIGSQSVKRALIGSIQGLDQGKLWSQYKRLCRKSPLDSALLGKVAETILWRTYDDAIQGVFDFDA